MEPTSSLSSSTKQLYRVRFISPLLRRILLVNFIPLALLVGALLYLNQFQNSLLTAEVTALREQARIYAGALSQSATGISALQDKKSDASTPFYADHFHKEKPSIEQKRVKNTVLLPELADPLLISLSQPSPAVHARLYAPDGHLIADSRDKSKKNSSVEEKNTSFSFSRNQANKKSFLTSRDENDRAEEALENISVESGAFSNVMEKISDELLRILPINRNTQLNILKVGDTDIAHPPSALSFDSQETPPYIRRTIHHHLLVTIAEPVQFQGRTIGIIQLTRAAKEVDRSLFAMRSSILLLFLLALTITVCLSWYLSQTIARPLVRLARSAHDMREKIGRTTSVSASLLNRNDEIGEVARALQESARALWTRMDAIEGFAADVSHEIKNPLSSIRSAIEAIPKINEESYRLRLLHIIRQDVDRLNRLISDISHASRIDAELSRASMIPINVLKILTMLVEMHEASRDKNAPHLQLKTPENEKEDAFIAIGIEDRLVQVFHNIIGNAISFSPSQGKILIALSVEQKGIKIEITDQGPGIPENKLASIFDRFYSERPEQEAFGQHSGLGLSISKQIITALNGELYAENNYNAITKEINGARFVIILPKNSPSGS